MEDLDLIRVQTQLACRVDPAGRLSPLPGQDLGDVPRLEVVGYAGGHVVFVRSDLSPAAQAAARAIDPGRVLRDGRQIPEELAREVGPPGTRDRRYRFAGGPPEVSAGVTRVGEHFVVLDGTRPVGWAWTAMEHGLAQEARVGRVRDGRRRDAARGALAAWVDHTLGLGKLAFFRHPESDRWSRTVALDLGAIELARARVFP